MKTSLAHALNNPDSGGASKVSLSSSYQVPATDGRMVLATPLKFCLNFRPPTIAVVYTLEKSKKSELFGMPRPSRGWVPWTLCWSTRPGP